MKQYGIYKGNRLLAKGIADDLAKDFNVVPQTIRSSARNNTMLQNTYIVREILEATTTLTDRQKEIIEEQFKSGKKVKEIAYNIGLNEEDINYYLVELHKREQEKMQQVDLDKLIEEKIKQMLGNSQPTTTLVSLKALGYKFNDNDKRFHLNNDRGTPIKTIQFANNAIHIRTFNSVKSEWNMPYTIKYDEIEAMFDYISGNRGY